MAVVTKPIKNKTYYYFQDSLPNKNGKYKVVNTMIGRTNLSNDELVPRKSMAFTKHLGKILRFGSILERPSYRFRSRPTVVNSDLLEMFRFIYKEALKNMTPQEKENFQTTIFVRYVNGTTAIEGNSLDEGQTYNILFQDLSPSNKQTNEIIEVRNYRILRGYLEEFNGEVSEKMIKKVHNIIMSGLVDAIGKPMAAGVYRDVDVGIGKASCKISHFQDVPGDMKKLLGWYADGIARRIHPIELAAIFHQRFECIHPFQDGNGRVGRAILDFMLRRSGFPPIYIPLEQRSEYLDTLNEADLGNYVKLIDFIIKRIGFTILYLCTKTNLFNGITSVDNKKFHDYFDSGDVFAMFVSILDNFRKSDKLL